MTISNAGKGESGYRNQKAGDQTGHEWQIRSWYSKPWKCVLRYPDAKVRDDIALLARHAADNDKIGYDMNDRATFWNQLKKVDNNDPKNITVRCEADCSSGVAAIVKAVGYRKGIKALQDLNPDIYTGNMRAAFKKAGFEVLTASKYLDSDKYLYAGDILLNDDHHVAINLTQGSNASGSSSSKPASSGKLDVDGKVGPATVKAWQRVMGTTVDGVISNQTPATKKYQQAFRSVEYDNSRKGSNLIKAVQKKLGIKADGLCGPGTIKAIQKHLGVSADGYFGSDTAKALQRKLNEGKF